MKRSATLWVLAIFFAWATLKSAGSIYAAQAAADYVLLSSIGWGALFYVFSLSTMLGEAATAFLLFRRKAKAYFVGSAVIVLECVSGIFTSAVSALHSDTAKAVYAASREARGMSARPDSELDFMFSTTGIGVMMLAYIAFWAFIFYCLRRVKPEMTSQ